MTSRPSKSLPEIPADTAVVLGEPHLIHSSPEQLYRSPRHKPNSTILTSEPPAPTQSGLSSPNSHYSDLVPEVQEVLSSRHPSPSIIEGTTFSISPSPTPPDDGTTKRDILILMIRHTSGWVLGGIGLMIAGIGLAQGVILPRIFTCPPGADCPLSFDPNKTSILTYLQSLMQYLHTGSMLIASIGLLQLSAYQAWFIMMRDGGNTMDNLDLTLGAIRGSLLDATRLLGRKGNRWLSAYIIFYLGVGAATSLVISFSIARGQGTQLLTFTYPGNTQFPNSNLGHLNSVGQLKAIAKVNAWALGNDTSHSHAYRGTLVTPDVRKIANNSTAAGYVMRGTLSCTGFNNYTVVTSKGKVTRYNLHLGGHQYIVTPGMRLTTSMTSVDTASAKYIWASNTKGRLPNATESSDGKMYFTFCTHKIHLTKIPKAKKGLQELHPTTPQTSGCKDDDPNVCVSDAVNNAIVSWWGGLGTSMWGMNCRGSVLGPLPRSHIPKEDKCALTEKLWSETTVSMMDAIVQTGPRSLNTTQKLIVPVENLNPKRWWLQAIIPFLALLLYAVGLYYTLLLSQGRYILKKLNLAEVIEAAQTDHVRGLLDSGNLEKTRVQYGSETGFIIPNHPARTTDDEMV